MKVVGYVRVSSRSQQDNSSLRRRLPPSNGYVSIAAMNWSRYSRKSNRLVALSSVLNLIRLLHTWKTTAAMAW